MKDFSRLAAPLYQVVGKYKFQCGSEQERASTALKDALTNPPVLALPNQCDAFVLDTDASDFAIGAELLQIHDGKEKVIAYGSYSLTTNQRKYCATRKELLAVVRFTRQYRHYLLGRPFMVRTDHSSLTWLMHFHEPQGQLARWLEELSQYNMVLRHREGRKHTNADALSRITAEEGHCSAFERDVRPEDLPCGGCKYCVRADQIWGAFTEAVDDAVLLVSQGVRNPVSGDGHTTDATREWSTRGRVGRRDVKADEGIAENQVGETGKTVQAVGVSLEMPCFDMEAPCEGGSDLAHVDIICTGGEVRVLTRGHSREVETKSGNKPSSWGFSLENLKEAQGKDEELRFILNWLTNSVTPGEGELFMASPATKSYWLNKEQFVLIDGVLYQNEAVSGDKKLIIPATLRELAVQWNHDLPSAGHQGRTRTKERVKEKFAWFGLGKFVTQYVAGCEVCNKCKKSESYD